MRRFINGAKPTKRLPQDSNTFSYRPRVSTQISIIIVTARLESPSYSHISLSPPRSSELSPSRFPPSFPYNSSSYSASFQSLARNGNTWASTKSSTKSISAAIDFSPELPHPFLLATTFQYAFLQTHLLVAHPNSSILGLATHQTSGGGLLWLLVPASPQG